MGVLLGFLVEISGCFCVYVCAVDEAENRHWSHQTTPDRKEEGAGRRPSSSPTRSKRDSGEVSSISVLFPFSVFLIVVEFGAELGRKDTGNV